MAEIKKTFAQIEEDANRNLNQFAFLLFIPNPVNRTVKYYVDGENAAYIKSKEDFIKVIKHVCGQEEANRIEVACMEYGIPYLYDRTKKMLKQVKEKSPGRNIDISENTIVKSIKKQNPVDPGSVFNDILLNL